MAIPPAPSVKAMKIARRNDVKTMELAVQAPPERYVMVTEIVKNAV